MLPIRAKVQVTFSIDIEDPSWNMGTSLRLVSDDAVALAKSRLESWKTANGVDGLSFKVISIGSG